jgi:surface polysaccharide O-acyltransferase-like enzyme
LEKKIPEIQDSFINSIHYFRAISILIIVMGHSFWFAGYEPVNLLDKALANMIRGGTAFFVFISGYLFHHIFYPRFSYFKFILKKVQYILVPYVVVSIPWLIVLLFLHKKLPGITGENPLLGGLFYLATGTHLGPFWYIPFIMVIFALSPLFLLFIHMKYKLALIIPMILISVFICRPGSRYWSVNFIHTIVYLVPAYLLGIWASCNRERIIARLRGNEFYFLAAAFVLALVQAVVFEKFGNISKDILGDIFSREGFYLDISFLQKILLCLFFMVFLHRFEKRNIPLLHTVATSSFAIYFLHFYIEKIGIYVKGLFPWFPGSPATLMVATIIASGLSILVAMLVKKLYGKDSRYIVGC